MAENQPHDLRKIQWSEESLKLSDFVTRYPPPQIVQVEEGFHGGSDENSLSSGQVLKIHTLTTERKILCHDSHEKELYIPFYTQEKIVLRPENYDTVYQRVADLSRARPLPSFVEVTRGYYNVDSNVDYELSVEPGDKLEVLSDTISINLSRLQKKNKTMVFRTLEGVEIKLPFDCVAGFKPLVDDKTYYLNEIIPNEYNCKQYPFYFEFLTEKEAHQNLGVLKCISSYDDRLIIASSGQGNVQVVFMMPYNLDVTVKVAVGALKDDPAYENIKSNFHNFETIENYVQNSRVSQIFRTSSQFSGIKYVPGKYNRSHKNWETFEEPGENGNLSSEEIYCRESLGRNCSFDTPSKLIRFDEDKGTQTEDEDKDEESEQCTVEKCDKTTETNEDEMISYMSVCEICENLRSLNMVKHVEMFEENQIDGKLLSTLEFEDFHELGLKRLEIKKLFSFRDGWRPKLI